MQAPEAGPGEVRIRVVASATNPVEAKIRASGHWAKIALPAVIGYDAAGVVEQVGIAVDDLRVGDAVYTTPEIFGNAHGSHAELVVVRASIVAKKPARLSFEEAAAVPLAGGTAYEAIVRRLRVAVGETVLIHGGAGGVGSFAVQIAKACGARVLATAGAANQELLKKLGADVAIDYSQQDASEVALRETSGEGVDAAFDTVGGTLESCIAATRPFGRIATILGPRGELGGLYLKNQSLHGVFLTRERARLDALSRLFEQGRVAPLVDQVVPFELQAVQRAHERLDSGHGRGKLVIRVSQS